VKHFFFVVVVLFALACLSAVAADSPVADQTPNVVGNWQVSWQARLGTEQATIVLKEDGARLSGTFRDAHHSSSLTGAIEGKNISFEVEFQGSRPYTIAFKGTMEGDKISGTSQAQNIGGTGAYLGHGGEIVQPEHPWTASRPRDPPRLKTQATGTAGSSTSR